MDKYLKGVAEDQLVKAGVKLPVAGKCSKGMARLNIDIVAVQPEAFALITYRTLVNLSLDEFGGLRNVIVWQKSFYGTGKHRDDVDYDSQKQMKVLIAEILKAIKK